MHSDRGDEVEERQWAHAIRRGNRECLQDIAKKYYDDIYRFCAFQTGSREAAYDLAQETFLRFIKYAGGYRDRNLKGYLLTIGMNVCRDYLARKRRERAAEVPLDEEWMQTGEWEGQGEYSAWESRRGGGQESADRGRRLCGNVSVDAAGYPEVSGRMPAEGSMGMSVSADMSGPERRVLEADIHARLMEALGRLPEAQREAVLLHYLCDMKYREIGQRTKVPASTVKSRVRQGMDKLQSMLRKEDFLDG